MDRVVGCSGSPGRIQVEAHLARVQIVVELWDARWRLRARVPTDLLYHTRTLVLDVLTTGGPGSVASARYIATATLADAGGNATRAAERIGVSRKFMQRAIAKYRLRGA